MLTHFFYFQNYVRKFSNVAADLERLQKCTNELQVSIIMPNIYITLVNVYVDLMVFMRIADT